MARKKKKRIIERYFKGRMDEVLTWVIERLMMPLMKKK